MDKSALYNNSLSLYSPVYAILLVELILRPWLFSFPDYHNSFCSILLIPQDIFSLFAEKKPFLAPNLEWISPPMYHFHETLFFLSHVFKFKIRPVMFPLSSWRTIGVRSKKGFGETVMQIVVEEHPEQQIEAHGRCNLGLQCDT